ncbi:Protoporphyrinogen oxidase [Lentithecium fluviatile CBS 122367]|uniref:Protoporphyrinogen oxidase n=1 Tax=Lentithecium fluviatile CBS 122367 TaxID=1168545 RepID=A0A6G1IEX5_9PLEO|nr:Protoporphyrinogen oxidase [Lentithecium fluviatile CBS 122367]
MRLRRHVPLLQSTLKHVSTGQFAPSLCVRCRRYASSATYPENIAVLGGGISGLASAHFISKEFPNSKITVYESDKDTGGWIQSRREDVPGGNVLFEHGPRTLRPGPNCMPTAQLIQDLDLLDNVLYSKRTSVGAKNRFIYYPDRLNQLPSPGEPPQLGNIIDLWRSGLLAGVFSTLLEPWRPPRPHNLVDESIGSFITRRTDKRIANNVVSAVMHGIYAGDVWQLSARTLLAQAWKLEGLHGSVWRGMFNVNSESPHSEQVALSHPYDHDALRAMREDISLDNKFVDLLGESTMFSFRNGLQELIKALQRKLEGNGQVEFKLETRARDLKYIAGAEPKVELIAEKNLEQENLEQTTQKYDLVISSLPDKSLAPYVTVMTVNLFFPKPGLLPVQGFGYLIPQSIPFEQNPERALGVIFDSYTVTGQDTASGTKLTVMLGGHWWNDWTHFPDQNEGVELARSVIRRHLHITDDPIRAHVNLSEDCIPQYTVGYDDRLKAFAQKVRDDYRGRVRMVGNLYHGVGVNDCVKAAWLVARGLRGNGWKEWGTGLERALDEREWVAVPMGQGMGTRGRSRVGKSG